MATQYTSILKLALPTQGELSGTWGDVVNDNITSMVEEAIAGRSVINSWAANSHTLTTADGLTSESRAAMLEFTDTGTALSGAATVICPTATKIYVCKNGAGQTVTVKTAAGTGVAIPNGETMFVFCDGTNVVQAVTSLTTLKVGTGIQVSTILDEDNMASDSATALATQQSIKAYVDAQITAQDLDFAGDTGTGAVDLDSQTFTVAGTANEIETSASGQTITIGLPTAIVVTTITTTNVQATNIKANDGTAAITIADSTGQVTVTDAVLTTADINGGTADNVTIGGSTAAAGSFTTLGASGTTTLSGALALTGNLDINTNKFNVTAVDGNTLIAGTLGVTGNVDLNGGAIDGTVIGNSTAAAGTFTTFTSTGIDDNATSTAITIDASENVGIGVSSLVTGSSRRVLQVSTGADGGQLALSDSTTEALVLAQILEIYNDGSDSYITHTTGGNFFINDDGAGYLMMKGSDLYFRNPSNVDMIHAQSGGFVKLYHNAVAKLATTATGIDVTGTVTADGLTVDAGASDIAIVFDDNSVTNRYQFTTGGNSLDSYFNINSDATRAAHLKTVSGSVSFDIASGFGRNDISFNGADLFIKRGGTKALEVDQATGDLSLIYEDTGTTAKFFWDASAESLGIGTSSPCNHP
jgi:cytoskeletal protein CcmA (bactofilin family)